MTRNLPSAVQAETVKEQVTALHLVECEFSGGTLYANTSAINIVYNGNTYLGVGKLGAISDTGEETDISASSIKLQLVGIDTSLVSAALNETFKNRQATIFVAFLDNNDSLVGTPTIIFRGRMESMDMSMGEEAVIAINVISRLADWERTRRGRYTNEDQQDVYTGDKGLEFCVKAVEKQIFWGRNDPN